MKRKLGMFLAVAAVTFCTYAQDSICRKDEQPKDCFVRFGSEWAEREVSTANTGVSNLVAPLPSASNDFLSRLAAALIVPMSGDGSMPLAIASSIPIGKSGKDHLKLEAVFARPKLSSDVEQRLAANAAAMIAVKDSLSQFDDVTVSATLDRSSLGLGRGMAPHRAAYESMAAARFHADGMTTERAAASAEELRTDLFARNFAMLLNNQPQFYGSVLYRARKSVAGSNERSARVSYEHGFRNLNSFYRANGGCRGRDLDDAGECARLLAAFADSPETDPGNRVSMSLEYRESNGVDVVLPNYAVNFNASGAHSLLYSLAYSREMALTNDDRLDLAVNYEDTTVSKVTDLIPTPAVVQSSKAVRDRFVASATYTYKINGQMAMPVSLIYANHATYLGEVDRRLNAHIGITFKMP